MRRGLLARLPTQLLQVRRGKGKHRHSLGCSRASIDLGLWSSGGLGPNWGSQSY